MIEGLKGGETGSGTVLVSAGGGWKRGAGGGRKGGETGSGTVLVSAGEDRQVEELARLVETLGLEVLGELEQGRRDGVGYLGRGKRAELKELVQSVGASFVVSDDELSPSQARVLEEAAGVTLVDRTLLIIRIFQAQARRAGRRPQGDW